MQLNPNHNIYITEFAIYPFISEAPRRRNQQRGYGTKTASLIYAESSQGRVVY
jgi:hypothetical protein